jgi:hypothetical protein
MEKDKKIILAKISSFCNSGEIKRMMNLLTKEKRFS